MADRTRVVDVTLPDGKKVPLRATELGGPGDVGALDNLDFSGVIETIEEVSGALRDALLKAAPKRSSVSFGVEVGVKTGKLVSLIAEGSGKATFTVTLEWEK